MDHENAELERFKTEINFPDFAAVEGYVLQRAKGTRSSLVLEHKSTGERLVVRRDPDRHWVYFCVADLADGGTIIDFVRRRRGLTLGHVRRVLRPWILTPEFRPVPPPDGPRVELEPQLADRDGVRIAFAAAKEVPTSLYLNRRGLRPETLHAPRFRATWRVDARGNVVFPHSDDEGLSGYEIKNDGFSGFASGGVKTLWRSCCEPSDTRLVLAESAIDALSYHQLRPDGSTRYGSIGGSLGAHQQSVLPEAIAAMPPGSTIILAFDRDAAGDRLADQVSRLVSGVALVRSAPTSLKDWNDVLKQREREYIASL